MSSFHLLAFCQLKWSLKADLTITVCIFFFYILVIEHYFLNFSFPRTASINFSTIFQKRHPEGRPCLTSQHHRYNQNDPYDDLSSWKFHFVGWYYYKINLIHFVTFILSFTHAFTYSFIHSFKQCLVRIRPIHTCRLTLLFQECWR